MTATSFVRAAALAGAVLLAAGCGGSTQGAGPTTTSMKPTPATSSTRSAAPSTTVTRGTTSKGSTSASPTGRSMAEKYPETPAGAEAFVRAFLGAYNSASRNPEKADLLKPFYKDSCKGCVGMHSGVSSYGQRGLRQNNQALTVQRIRSEPNGAQRVVLVAVKQNPGLLVDSEGVAKSDIPGVDNVVRAYILNWTRTGWSVTDMKGYRGEI